MRVDIRKARPADITRLSGATIVEGGRYIGWTGWIGRLAVGTGGVVMQPDGRATALFGCLPGYRHLLGVSFHRRTVRLLKRLDMAGVKTLVAMCDPEIEPADRWLRRLGFRPRGDVIDGEMVYVRGDG